MTRAIESQNKKRKSNHEKSKHSVQNNSRVLIPLLLACLAAVFIWAPNPASARDKVPFSGTLAGCVDTQERVDDCTLHTDAVLFADATQLGALTRTGVFYQNFCEDHPNITYAGS